MTTTDNPPNYTRQFWAKADPYRQRGRSVSTFWSTTWPTLGPASRRCWAEPTIRQRLARSLALSFLVGGLSADMCFFTVFLAIPKSGKWPGGTGPAPWRTTPPPSRPAGSPWASGAAGGEAVSPYRPCVW